MAIANVYFTLCTRKFVFHIHSICTCADISSKRWNAHGTAISIFIKTILIHCKRIVRYVTIVLNILNPSILPNSFDKLEQYKRTVLFSPSLSAVKINIRLSQFKTILDNFFKLERVSSFTVVWTNSRHGKSVCKCRKNEKTRYKKTILQTVYFDPSKYCLEFSKNLN